MIQALVGQKPTKYCKAIILQLKTKIKKKKKKKPKWVIVLNLRAKTIKFLLENIRISFCDSGFLDRIPRAWHQEQNKNR